MVEPGLLISKSVCAPGVDGPVCFSSSAIEVMKKSGDRDYLQKIDRMLTDSSPDHQLELLYDDRTAELLGDTAFAAELTTKFKAHAPQGNKLFSNFNEDTILEQFQRAIPTFKYFKCELMDFPSMPNSALAKSLNSNSELVQGIKDGSIEMFGTIPNTLVSTGDTSRVGHWVAMFGDFRGKKWTIEYYNSSGNNAPAKVYDWMQKLATTIGQECNNECIAVNVSNIASQKGPSECGIYSLHYIICRILGTPYKTFREHSIPDAEVQKIRKLFLDEQSIRGGARRIASSLNLL